MMNKDLRYHRRVFIRIHDYFKFSCLNTDGFILISILVSLHFCVRFHDGKARVAFFSFSVFIYVWEEGKG